jgi:hypothetical protein
MKPVAVLLILLLAGATIAVLPSCAGSGVPADHGSWVGQKVLMKRADVPPRATDDDGHELPPTVLTDAVVVVEKDDGHRVRVHERAGPVWLAKEDVVPLSKAIDYFTERIRQDDKDAYAYSARAVAHDARGELDLAIKDHGDSIRLMPEWPAFRVNRAESYYRKHDYANAATDFAEAIRLDPKRPDAITSLAWLLSTCPDASQRDGKRARELAEKACVATSWKDGNCLDNLAAACAECGDFTGAVQWEEKALADPTFAKQYGARARKRLQLYREKKPFRDE